MLRSIVLLGLLPILIVAQAPPKLPTVRYVAGATATFATHTQLTGYNFAWGPSDGEFGAIPAGGGRYMFYGAGGSAFACNRTRGPIIEGAFAFTGTLDRVSGGDGCKKLFGPSPGPAAWTFARDYAGGGQVVRFSGGGKSGWLMVLHGEYWWQNPNTPDHKCSGAACFYSSLGLAMSTDGGQSFKVVGEIVQPSPPRSYFTGGGNSMPIGYGSLIVADADGKHLDNPPADPSRAYFYTFYTDFTPGLPGVCATAACLAVARAPYGELVEAVLSNDPHRVAKAFHKYDGASPDPWMQPATSDTLDNSVGAGKFAPLWTQDTGGQPTVLYDHAFDVYLAAYVFGGGALGIRIRASRDLIHWSGPIGAPIQEPGRTLYYPTLLGETGEPTIGGPAPRLYFTSFATFPDYGSSVFETIQLTLSSP
ncbi:MAG TPA: hypothetical protein VKZ50_06545 [bacterium]|nr:hypothetical protein [bacterium]